MKQLPLRVGVVGTGIVWNKTHRRILSAFPERVAIAALCARTEVSRQKAHGDYPGAKLFSDYKELVADPAVDAVLVATPIGLNAEVALVGLKAGKTVFMEKPLGANLAEANALADLATQGEAKLYVLEQQVYPDACSRVAELIASNEIGKIVSFERFSGFKLAAGADPSGYGNSAWRIDADYPLGPLFDGGIHEIALLSNLFGNVTSVYAEGRKLRANYGDYDLIQMTLNYATGVIGSFVHSGLLSGQYNTFHIRGMNGVMVVDRAGLNVLPNIGATEPEARRIEFGDKDWHMKMWDHILMCAANGQDALYTPGMALHDVRTLLGVEESLKECRAVMVG